MCDWVQVLVKRSPTLGTLVSTKTKCIKLIFIWKNNICTSCVFNGFKYTWVSKKRTHKVVCVHLKEHARLSSRKWYIRELVKNNWELVSIIWLCWHFWLKLGTYVKQHSSFISCSWCLVIQVLLQGNQRHSLSDVRLSWRCFWLSSNFKYKTVH